MEWLTDPLSSAFSSSSVLLCRCAFFIFFFLYIPPFVKSWVVGVEGSPHPDSDCPETIDPLEYQGEPLELNGQKLTKTLLGRVVGVVRGAVR